MWRNWRQAERQRRAARRGQPLRWNRAALAAALPVALVAVIAGKVSYSHITALGMRTHQGYTDSHLLFLPIDGLIVAGTVILVAGSSLGWLGVTLGVAATLFANLQFGLPHGPLSAVVSTWPAIAFTAACFMLERWIRSQRRQPAGTVTLPVMAHVNGNGSKPAQKTPAMTKQSQAADVIRDNPGLTNAELAGLAGCDVRTISRARNGKTPLA
jgi:hypothetical protein